MARWAARRDPGRAPRALAAVLLVLALLTAAPPSRAVSLQEVGDGTVEALAIAYDLAILRPLYAGAVVLGTGFFAASLPLVAPFEGLGTSWDAFVYAPFEYTVLRDLGEF